MKTWFALVDVIALFCLVVICHNTFVQVDIYQQQYNEQRLSRSVEYAAEVAFLDSAGVRNNDIMYETPLDISINPKQTLKSFDMMMEFNYGLALNETSDTAIEDSIGVALLAADDGYYLSKFQRVSETEESLYWSPKLPYVATNPNDPSVAYAVSLMSSRNIKVQMNGTTKPTVTESRTYDTFLTDTIRRRAISNTITDAVTHAIDDNIYYGQDAGHSFYIPSSQTISGINDIHSPSFLVIIRDAVYAGCPGIEKAALTGNKAIRMVRVIGYTDAAGNKLYSYENQGAADSPDYKARKYFNRIEDAAMEGYKADKKYIFNKVDREF